MLQVETPVETPHVGPPDNGQIWGLWPVPPQPQLLRGCVGRGRRLTSTRISMPWTSGRGAQVPRVACSCGLGCKSAQARTRTVPSCASATAYSSDGGSQVAGSAQANLWLCRRRGRPVGCCSAPVRCAPIRLASPYLFTLCSFNVRGCPVFGEYHTPHMCLDGMDHNDEADQGPACDPTKGLIWPRAGHDGMSAACRKMAKIHEKAPDDNAERLDGGGDWI